jgi:hypothetical protein
MQEPIFDALIAYSMLGCCWAIRVKRAMFGTLSAILFQQP